MNLRVRRPHEVSRAAPGGFDGALAFVVDDLAPAALLATPRAGSLTLPAGRYLEADSDGDGSPDELENWTGTNPRNPRSAPPWGFDPRAVGVAQNGTDLRDFAYAVPGARVRVTTDAKDNAGGSGVAAVDLYVEGVLVGSAIAPPYAIEWLVPEGAGGALRLRVVARDHLGNANASERGLYVIPADPAGVAAAAGDAGEAQPVAPGIPRDAPPPPGGDRPPGFELPQATASLAWRAPDRSPVQRPSPPPMRRPRPATRAGRAAAAASPGRGAGTANATPPTGGALPAA